VTVDPDSSFCCFAIFYGALSILSVVAHRNLIDAVMIIFPVTAGLYPVYLALP
jgi:hypothetical protein